VLGLLCKSATVTGTRQVTGSLTLTADSKFTDKTVTKGTETWVLGADCLEISGTKTDCDGISGMLKGTFGPFGYTEFSCADFNSGCKCSGTLDTKGGIGLTFNDLTATGKYTSGTNSITLWDTLQYAHCAAGNTLTVIPQSESTPIKGTIVFQKSDAGTGGTGGGTGGTTSTGGKAGSGGTTSSGGTTVKGGTTSGGTTATGGTGGSSTGTPPAGDLPCDIYGAAATPTPCVAAYSMVRLIAKTYTGPLFQVRKGGTYDAKTGPAGGTTKDIGMVDGYGDAKAVDDFCADGTCTVSILYDQSGKGNHLKAGPPGCYTGGDGGAAKADKEAVANRRPVKINGHSVYALETKPYEGYRINNTKDVPKDKVGAQGIYMVADGKKAGTQCCWDFGNAMPTNCADGTGSMDALMLGTGGFGKGAGKGPWFIGDFEFGVWACGSQGTSQGCTNPDLPSMDTTEFAFGILKTNTVNGVGQYCLRAADPKDGVLKTAYDGKAPQNWHLGGAILLGVGGDNSNWSYGTFFEGAVTAGRPADDVEAKVYANFQAAKYGQ
jgi:hypothetical protein